MPWIITTTLTVFVPLIVIYWYLGKKLLNAIVLVTKKDRKKVRRIIVATCAILNLFPVVFLIVFLIAGRTRIPAFAGESLAVDLLLVYPFWFALVIAVQLFLVAFLADLIRLMVFPFYRKFKERWRTIQSRSLLAALGVISVYSITTIVKDTWTVRVHEAEYLLPEHAGGLNGVRLVHISDVQGDGRTSVSRLQKFVEKINLLEPDLVLFSGDLVTSGERYIESSARVLGGIQPRVAKIAAVGDHDIFSDKSMVMDAMRSNGFVIADDTTITVSVKGIPVTISLLTQTYPQKPEKDDFERVLQNANGFLKILLVHQPAESLVSFAEENDYHLFLAGHTHGGGIAFGIPGFFLVAPASFESRYVSGFYLSDGMLVSITNGLGMTLAPIRFHAPAEISLITLKGS